MLREWEKGMCLVTGDSMINGIDQRKILKKRLVKVHLFPGARIQDKCVIKGTLMQI